MKSWGSFLRLAWFGCAPCWLDRGLDLMTWSWRQWLGLRPRLWHLHVVLVSRLLETLGDSNAKCPIWKGWAGPGIQPDLMTAHKNYSQHNTQAKCSTVQQGMVVSALIYIDCSSITRLATQQQMWPKTSLLPCCPYKWKLKAYGSFESQAAVVEPIGTWLGLELIWTQLGRCFRCVFDESDCNLHFKQR